MSRSASGQWRPPAELVALREKLAEVFEAGGGVEVTGDAAEAALRWTPSADVVASPELLEVTVEATGARARSLEVEVAGTVLTVRGKRTRTSEGVTYHRLERAMGPFERTIQLPSAVDASRAEARIDRGILTIRLPIAEQPSSTAQRITVRD